MATHEKTLGHSKFILSPIAAARQKKKQKRKDSGAPMVDSFLKRFTTRREQCVIQPNPNPIYESVEEGATGNAEGYRDESIGSVIDPHGGFLIFWLTVVSLAVVYNLWVLIAREAWEELQDGGHVAWFVLDYISDIIYVLDMVVHARTAYLEQGLLVKDGKKLRRHYCSSWKFKVDILSLLPTDLFYLLQPKRLHPIIRCPRFLRVYRFHFWYTRVETIFQFPNTFRVLNLTHVLLLGVHWTGSAYYLICSTISDFSPELYSVEGHGMPNVTLAYKYLASFYWSTLTLTTIGDLPTPHTEIEYIVQIIGYFVGIFIFATIVGQVGNIIENRNLTRMEFERQVDHAKLYMRTNNVPRDVQLRVLRWYDYTWTRGATRGQCDVNSLSLLPDTHRAELALHVNLQTLKKVSILKKCPPEFLHDLVLKMHLCIFTPDDLVCKKGAVAREMYIISDGFFKVTDESGHVVNTLKSGDYFGEIGILNLEGNSHRRTSDVYSVGYSELFSLSKDDVLGVLKDYPLVKSIMEEEALKKLECRLHTNGTDIRVHTSHERIDIQSEFGTSNSDLRANDGDMKGKRGKKGRMYLSVPPKSWASSPSSTPRSNRYSEPPEIAMTDVSPAAAIVSENDEPPRNDTSPKTDTSTDVREMIRMLQRDNHSKASYIQALEKRNKELEELLRDMSQFQSTDL